MSRNKEKIENEIFIFKIDLKTGLKLFSVQFISSQKFISRLKLFPLLKKRVTLFFLRGVTLFFWGVLPPQRGPFLSKGSSSFSKGVPPFFFLKGRLPLKRKRGTFLEKKRTPFRKIEGLLEKEGDTLWKRGRLL